MANILLISLGSRGDIEPFLAAGEELQAQGHKVAFCLPAQFEALANEVTPFFYAMSSAFLDLMNEPGVKRIIGQIGSPISRLATSVRLMRTSKALQHTLIRDQKAAVDDFNPDTIIYHVKCVYPAVAALRDKRSVQLLSPVPTVLHAVEYEPTVGFGRPRSVFWNKLTYRIANAFLIHLFVKKMGSSIVAEQGWAPLQYGEIKDFLLNELPVEYAVSVSLFPRPNHWPPQAQVTVFRERDKRRHWVPSAELIEFLNQHPNPLYIGFGSMVNDRPKQIGESILRVTEELGIPVVLNTCWGGIEVPGIVPNHVFTVNDIPFDWLFSRVRGVVHHGGSGTTHSAFACNKSQLIIPHIGDQFMWQRLVVKAKLGPMGFPIKAFSDSALREALLRLKNFEAP